MRVTENRHPAPESLERWQSCKSATINCSNDGPCSMACSNANQACQSAVLTCGGNACAATCAGPNDPPTVTCGSACACTAC